MKTTLPVMVAALVGPFLANASGFSNSCKDIKLKGSAQLWASCLNLNKQYISTYVDLDTCVGNNNGTLGWYSGGDFSATCGNSRLVSTTTNVHLVADCDENGNGKVITASLSLNYDVTNNNGHLQC